jgi:protein involved in polysaccharide export with SLBB domain
MSSNHSGCFAVDLRCFWHAFRRVQSLCFTVLLVATIVAGGAPNAALAQTAGPRTEIAMAAQSGSSIQAETPAQPGVEGAAADEYVLSPNDKLKITVFGEEDLSGEFVVDATGNVSIPLIGEVRAAGTSLRAFQRNIEAQLRAGYLVDPRVSAEILNFRPFYVLGEVKNPGEYGYTSGLTLLNAIAQAGGFTPLANTSAIAIKRLGAEGEFRWVVQAGMPISPGDTLRIEKAAVYIIGEVKRPGEYPIPLGLNLVTAVAQAEGYTELADLNRVFVKRAGSNVEEAVPVSTGALVQPGDTLRVGRSSFFILGEVNRPGEYPAPENLTVNNAAAIAGGFTFRADTKRIWLRRSGELEEKRVKITDSLVIRQGDTIRIAERFF